MVFLAVRRSVELPSHYLGDRWHALPGRLLEPCLVYPHRADLRPDCMDTSAQPHNPEFALRSDRRVDLGRPCPVLPWPGVHCPYSPPVVRARYYLHRREGDDVRGRLVLGSDADVLSDDYSRGGKAPPAPHVTNRSVDRACKPSRFFEQAAQILRERHGDPVSLLAFDLDHFKAINDRHGHPTGDRVLQLFAETAREQAGPDALIVRLGGEEFAALLPRCDHSQALNRGSAIASRFAEAAARAEGLKTGATVSIGLAAPDCHDLAGTLASADGALYRAKALGRNRVETARPNELLLHPSADPLHHQLRVVAMGAS